MDKKEESQTQKASVIVHGTWKPHMVAYRIIKEMKNMDKGAVVEVITKDNEGILKDINTWCEATGHIFLGSEKKGEKMLSSLIQKGEPKKNDHKMTVIISTVSLEHVLYPLDQALAGAVLGMEVNIVFEGAGVRLLKKDYRSKLSGLIGGLFTGFVKRIMKKEIGWPLPQETITMLDDLGAHFYICGPSMFGYKVQEEELTIEKYTIAAHLTWTDLLANTDIHIFSRAVFEKP
ncbi:MAG: sulfurtransferase TusA family protein [Candidatus Methanofastidiosia archaeon]